MIIMISLDVINLLTNVPEDLVIEEIAKRWHLIEKSISIPYKEFLTALKLIMNFTYFKFNSKIYK